MLSLLKQDLFGWPQTTPLRREIVLNSFNLSLISESYCLREGHVIFPEPVTAVRAHGAPAGHTWVTHSPGGESGIRYFWSTSLSMGDVWFYKEGWGSNAAKRENKTGQAEKIDIHYTWDLSIPPGVWCPVLPLINSRDQASHFFPFVAVSSRLNFITWILSWSSPQVLPWRSLYYPLQTQEITELATGVHGYVLAIGWKIL